MGRQRGFVMADAMIALVLISLLMVALLGINRNSAALAAKTEQRLTAVMIAQSVLEDVAQQGEEGEVLMSGRSYRWIRAVRDITEASRPRLKLNEITITVTWQENQSVQRIDLKSARVRGLS